MAGKTSIEWRRMPAHDGYEGYEGYAPGVWNPVSGCTRVSAGCDNCYAFALHDKRFASNLKAAKAQAPGWTSKPRTLNTTIIREARAAGATLPYRKQYDLPSSVSRCAEPLHTCGYCWSHCTCAPREGDR